ncbi:MAG: hypothetical protein CMF54_01985 [Legionellales bacterium]|nr:hypothetical protein [Legionellales bacterium]
MYKLYLMEFSYYFGFFPALGFNVPQYLFLVVFILFATFGFINFVAFRVETNYRKIVYLLSYFLIWFFLGGLVSGLLMAAIGAIMYILIREFAGDYS